MSLKTSAKITTTAFSRSYKTNQANYNNTETTNKSSGTFSLPFLNEYSAPEVRDGIQCDYASDVYSLGLLILSSLCNVSQEKLRRVTEAAYNPQPISSDHYTSHLDSRNNKNISDIGKINESKLRGTMVGSEKLTMTASLRDVVGAKCP